MSDDSLIAAAGCSKLDVIALAEGNRVIPGLAGRRDATSLRGAEREDHAVGRGSDLADIHAARSERRNGAGLAGREKRSALGVLGSDGRSHDTLALVLGTVGGGISRAIEVARGRGHR